MRIFNFSAKGGSVSGGQFSLLRQGCGGQAIFNRSGQTLIETLAALFILVMGVSATVGLAIYAFATSTSITKQIVATGLAREGIEAVKAMRDTNWLNGTLTKNGCYDFSSTPIGAPTASCYQNWLGQNDNATLYCINPSNGSNCNGSDTSDTYFLAFNSSLNAGSWVLTKDTGNSYFGLNFDASNAQTNSGFYYPGSGNNGTTCQNSNSGYCRDIIITRLDKNDGAPAPYNLDPNLPLLKVQSQVWWQDKKCPVVNTFAAANSACRLELDTYFTNWKNY